MKPKQVKTLEKRDQLQEKSLELKQRGLEKTREKREKIQERSQELKQKSLEKTREVRERAKRENWYTIPNAISCGRLGMNDQFSAFS